MHLGMSRASRYFPVMINTYAYNMIFMSAMILCTSFPSVVFGSVSVCELDESGSRGTYTSPLDRYMCACVGCG